MNDSQVVLANAQIRELKVQRNNALDRCVELSGHMTMMADRIYELEKTLKERDDPEGEEEDKAD